MNNEHPLDDAAITAAVNEWIDANWDPNLSLRAWREILVDGGWATPHWPSQYFGRDFTQAQSSIVTRIFAERGIVPVAQGGPGRLAAETILAMGNDDQKRALSAPHPHGRSVVVPTV